MLVKRQSMGVALVLALVACKEMDNKWADEISSSTFALTGNTTLLPVPDPETYGGEKLGRIQDLDGDTAVVGSFGHDSYNGVVYVFIRTGTLWSLHQTFKLTASPLANLMFGRSVAVEGNVFAVGVPGLYVGAAQPGGVYIYERTGTTWAHAQTVTTADPGVRYFGETADLDGDTLVIGASLYTDDQPADPPGLAYVYVRNPTTTHFEYQAKLLAQNSNQDLGTGGVSVSGDFAAVGDDIGVTELYKRSGTTWTHFKTFTEGYMPEIEGSTLVIGGPTMQTYAYQSFLGKMTWIKSGTLTPPFGYPLGGTPRTAAIDGNRVLVGFTGNMVQGRVYLFEKGSSGWAHKLMVQAHDGKVKDGFGYGQLGLDGNAAVVGAAGNGKYGVYIVNIGEADGFACAANDKCISNMCVDDVCCSTVCSEPCAVCSIAAGGSADGKCTVASATTVCRSSAGPCDIEETCTGTFRTCPIDLEQPDNTPCPGGVCTAGVCSGGSSDGGSDLNTQQDATPPGLEPSTPPGLEPSTPPDASTVAPTPDAGEPSTSGGGCQIGALGSLPGPATAIPLLLLSLLVLIYRRRR